MEREFIYLLPYEAQERRTKGSLQAESTLEQLILDHPTRGILISGAGGIRKIRVGNEAGGRGKRGGFRFWYLDFERIGRTYVLWVIRKGDAENISAEVRAELRQIALVLKKEVQRV